MERTTLGATGIQVSRYCLGAMMLGAWANTAHAACARTTNPPPAAAITSTAPADVSSSGESEEIVGKPPQGKRDSVVLATKFGAPRGEDPNQRGASRRWIM